MKPLLPPAERAARGDFDGMVQWGLELTASVELDARSKGLGWLRKAADAWHLPARYELGRLTYEGKGGAPKDEAAGLALITSAAGRVPAAERWTRARQQGALSPLAFEAAARNGNMEGAYALGLLAVEATGPEARASARKWFRQAADGGHARAMFRLACVLDPQWFWFNHREEGDEAASLHWLARAAELGVPEAQEDWAAAALSGRRDPSTLAEAAGALTLAAEAGLPSAQFGLGKLLLRGDAGAAFDLLACHHWLTRAAAAGHGPAAALLADWFEGVGAPTEPAKLRELLTRIAPKEHLVPAYALLARMCEFGEGGPADLVEARRNYRSAAGGGDIQSTRQLVPIELALEGPGATLTLRAALRAIDQANLDQLPASDAAQTVTRHHGGLARARFELGRRLEQGEGVELSLPDAASWYLAAVETQGAGEEVVLAGLFAAARLLDANPSMQVPERIRRRAALRAGRPIVKYDALELGLRAAASVVEAANSRFRFWDDETASPEVARGISALWAGRQAAATAGESNARYELGWLLSEGLGVPRNDRQAERWLEAAVDKGSLAAACFLVVRLDPAGESLETGRRIVLLETLRRALALVTLDLSATPASREVDGAYREMRARLPMAAGAHVTPWTVAALENTSLRNACRTAAEGGDVLAQLAMGRVMSAGTWEEREQAYRWLLLAAAGGAPGARRERDRLGDRLDRVVVQTLQDEVSGGWASRPR